jgi:hypothetical protein
LHKLNVLYDWRSIKFIETVRRKKYQWSSIKINMDGKEENEKGIRNRMKRKQGRE